MSKKRGPIREQCNIPLDGAHSEIIATLLPMPPAIGREIERITSDEEERLREGYDVETFYRFGDDAVVDQAQVMHQGTPLLVGDSRAPRPVVAG